MKTKLSIDRTDFKNKIPVALSTYVDRVQVSLGKNIDYLFSLAFPFVIESILIKVHSNMKKFSFYKTRIQLITASLFKNIWSTLAQKNSKIKKKKKKF